jgi:hypothetical protein
VPFCFTLNFKEKFGKMAEKNGVNKNVLSDTLIPKNTPVRVFINSKSLVIKGSVSRD